MSEDIGPRRRTSLSAWRGWAPSNGARQRTRPWPLRLCVEDGRARQGQDLDSGPGAEDPHAGAEPSWAIGVLGVASGTISVTQVTPSTTSATGLRSLKTSDRAALTLALIYSAISGANEVTPAERTILSKETVSSAR